MKNIDPVISEKQGHDFISRRPRERERERETPFIFPSSLSLSLSHKQRERKRERERERERAHRASEVDVIQSREDMEARKLNRLSAGLLIWHSRTRLKAEFFPATPFSLSLSPSS